VLQSQHPRRGVGVLGLTVFREPYSERESSRYITQLVVLSISDGV
jgi:hypothetical protein